MVVCGECFGFNRAMLKNLPLFIGYRYTRSKRREGFLSFISAFSFGAMALGVASLIIVLSVLNGFDREIKHRLLKVIPHVISIPSEGIDAAQFDQVITKLNDDNDIDHVVPLIQSFIVISKGAEQMGVNLQAIDPSWPTAGLLSENMLVGHVGDLDISGFQAIIGSQIARKLGVGVGDKLQITLPQVSVTPAGIFPRIKRVNVAGIFEVGAQVDGSVIFLHQRDARRLLRLGDRYQGLQIQLNDGFMADSWINSRGQQLVPDTKLRSWNSTMGPLFRAMQMEKIVVSLLLSVIIAVAAFNIIASLVLMVADKHRDIAVMRTMGASSSVVAKIFIVQGMTVAGFGIFFGLLFGCTLAYFIGDIVNIVEGLLDLHLFDPSVYLISSLPSELVWSDVFIVVIAALGVSFCATLYPAWRAGQILPAEALRYDR